MHQFPRIIQLSKISGKSGLLSFIEEGPELPIVIKRAYWIYGSSETAHRGHHAHLNSDRIIVCMHGSAHIELENVAGQKFQFDLTHPSEALYFPRLHWIDLSLAPHSAMTVFTSCILEEDELVRDYEAFKRQGHSNAS